MLKARQVKIKCKFYSLINSQITPPPINGGGVICVSKRLTAKGVPRPKNREY